MGREWLIDVMVQFSLEISNVVESIIPISHAMVGVTRNIFPTTLWDVKGDSIQRTSNDSLEVRLNR